MGRSAWGFAYREEDLLTWLTYKSQNQNSGNSSETAVFDWQHVADFSANMTAITQLSTSRIPWIAIATVEVLAGGDGVLLYIKRKKV